NGIVFFARRVSVLKGDLSPGDFDVFREAAGIELELAVADEIGFGGVEEFGISPALLVDPAVQVMGGADVLDSGEVKAVERFVDVGQSGAAKASLPDFNFLPQGLIVLEKAVRGVDRFFD